MLKSLALAGLISVATSLPAHAQKADGEITRSEVPGEFIVCYLTPLGGQQDMDARLKEWNLGRNNPAFETTGNQPMARWQRPGENVMTNIALLRFGAGVDSKALIASLESKRGVAWVAPNYVYIGEAREVVPNDPQYGSQYHHPLMQCNTAWDAASGYGSASVIIAVTDDGVDITHPDLAPNIWVNADEIAANGIDDDANGFIDDRNGWDFSSNDNNPAPVGTDSHGTHVAGIAAARTNNTVGVAGVAGGCTIMPVRFYGSGSWTSTVIFNSFTYAVNNGAKIINTSYNIDGWVGDPTVTAGLNYIYDNGALHMNSGGNNGQLNPPRQAFHQTMLVVNTTSGDARNSGSNYGTGMELCAPGTSILSTLPGSTYGNLTGTSMATPAAAGVAALIWSKNPSWTRDQVAAQLVATCNNIDAQNPSAIGLLGGGRANANLGVGSATTAAPRIFATTGLPANGGTIENLTGGMKLRFNQVMKPSTVNTAGAFSLTYAGVDGVFGNGDDSPITLNVALYRAFSNETSLTVSGSLTCGRYRLVANASVLENPFGTDLDGDNNGSAGGNWQLTFTIEPCRGDVTCNGQVDTDDLLALLGGWGAGSGRADITGNGTVDTDDLLFLLGAWGPCIPPPPPGPANDNCANATPVGTGTVNFDNTLATLDGTSPITCGSSISVSRDMWYLFTPTSSGTATVTTCTAATFDTVLVAYTGVCGALTQVTCNDDFCGTSGLASQITFPVTSGTPVRIRLARYGSTGAGGTGTLTFSIAP